MSDDRTAHVHRCGCGETWTCSKPDCYAGDDCTRCEDEALAIWADAHPYQPLLEPASALVAAKDR